MRVQARIVLPSEVRLEIDELRARWNPERALGNPAHVTIAYHDEAPDPFLLAERLSCAAAAIAPFRLILGPSCRFPAPDRGAYLAVEDPTGSVATIRELLLTPPFHRRSRFGLHVTLLHPDQGERLEEAWTQLSNLHAPREFLAEEVLLLETGHSITRGGPCGPPSRPVCYALGSSTQPGDSTPGER